MDGSYPSKALVFLKALPLTRLRYSFRNLFI